MIYTDSSFLSETKIDSTFEEAASIKYAAIFNEFKRITRFYALFHVLYLGAFLLELFAFLLFFSFFTKSSLLAFFLAGMLLTGFSYFVLLFYFQAKKPEQFLILRDHYLKICRDSLCFEEGTSAYYLAIANEAYHFASSLELQEYNYYPVPKFLETLEPLMQKFSTWCHWKDVLKMKEMLLFASINQHIQLIKIDPSHIEAHASLATTYHHLSKFYIDPRKQYPELEHQWIPPAYFSEEMHEKFKSAAMRAIEEFKILQDYLSNDPWVHVQLASLYHDLEMPAQEIQEYETLLKIVPHDKEVLFRLGILYFQQGHNARALRIYELLKKAKDTKAEELIAFYDAYLPQGYFFESAE